MPQKYRFDLSLYFTKFFVDDNHMKLLMDPGVVLEELGIKDEDSILSEIRSRYAQLLNTLSGKFVNKHLFVYFRSSVCSLEHSPIYIYFFREIDNHFFQGWNMARRNKFLN